MRSEVIAKYIGNSLLLVAALMGLSAAVAAFNGFDDGFYPLLDSCAATAILGAFPNIFVRSGKKITRGEGFFVVVGSWLICCLMGVTPYVMYSREFTFVNALFESVSGFTTTGASILTDVEDLPRSILFWRMSTAWVGGIGIIALFTLFIPSAYKSDTALNSVEMSSIAMNADGLKPRSYTRTTILVYVILTLAAILSLKVSGMGWYDAVTQAMSACSTCGFSTRNSSIASFGNGMAELVLIFFMLLSSLRFSLLSCILIRRGNCFIKKSEVARTFMRSVMLATVILTVSLIAKGGYGSAVRCARMALFQVASIFSTTGFATADTNLWPPFCAAILVAGSLFCGCSGSTSGGMKTDRAVVVWKCFRRSLMHQRYPNRMANITVDGKLVKDDTCYEIMLYVVCYMAVILAGSLLNAAAGLDLKTAGTAAVACMGNVGPGLGVIGSMGNYSDMPVMSKCVSMVLMIIGRLEIFPVIFIFRAPKR